MGIFNGKAADVAEKALGFADKFGLTQKEKAEGVLEFIKNTIGENSTRSKTRRFVAIAIVSNYLLLINASAVLYCIGLVERAKFIFELANTSLGTAFVMVLAFFFGGYYVGKFKGQVKK